MGLAAAALLAALVPSGAYAEVIPAPPDVRPGQVVSWGGPADLQEVLSPPAGLDDAVAVSASDSAGSYSSLALRADGTVVGWGRNAFGEATPPEGLHDVVAIDSGAGFSVALRADGSVVTWGTNVSGQLDVPEDLGTVTAVSAGGYSSYQGIGVPDQPCGYALALRSDGTVARWGGDSAELGCDLIDARLDPPDGLTDVVAVSAGSTQALALRKDGTVVAWGAGVARGDGTPPEEWSDVVAISAGTGNSLGLRADGSVLAYGIWGEAGPPQVSDVAAISASNSDLFLHRDGTISVYPALVPDVPKDGGYVAVSAGYDYGLAIRSDQERPPEVVVGSTEVQPLVDSNPAGVAEAFRYTATASGEAFTFHAYVDETSTARRLIVGVYDDADGEPGRLLATSGTSEVTEGEWNSVSLADGVEVTAGRSYWLALFTPVGYGTIRFRDQPEESGGPTRLSCPIQDLAHRYLGLPVLWKSSRVFTNSPASLYLS